MQSSPAPERRDASSLSPVIVACARLLSSSIDGLSLLTGRLSASVVSILGCFGEDPGEIWSPNDDEGSNTVFSSAEDAVDGRLNLGLLGLELRESRGIGMWGTAEARGKEMSLRASDGTERGPASALGLWCGWIPSINRA